MCSFYRTNEKQESPNKKIQQQRLRYLANSIEHLSRLQMYLQPLFTLLLTSCCFRYKVSSSIVKIKILDSILLPLTGCCYLRQKCFSSVIVLPLLLIGEMKIKVIIWCMLFLYCFRWLLGCCFRYKFFYSAIVLLLLLMFVVLLLLLV